MATVDIPLNHYTYRFRKLTYVEEFALGTGSGSDSRKTVLKAALVSVSGLEITTREQAAGGGRRPRLGHVPNGPCPTRPGSSLRGASAVTLRESGITLWPAPPLAGP